MTVPNRQPTRLIALLSLLSLVGYALRSNITIAQELMAPELGLTMADMGIISAWGFQLAYALCQVPAGFLADRFGARIVLTVAVTGWAIASFATGLVGGGGGVFLTMFAARVLLGVSQAATYPAGSMAIGQAIPAGRRSTANAIFISTAMLGSALAPLILAPLMVQAGWRSVFMVSGLVGLAAAGLWFLLAPLPLRGTRTALSLLDQTKQSLALLKQRDLMILSTAYLLHSAVFFVFIFWFFRYLTDGRGMSLLTSGVWGSIPPFTAFLLAPLGGIAADRLGRRFGQGQGARRVAIVALFAAAALVMIGANLSNPFLAIGAMALSVAFINAAEGPFWTTAIALGKQAPGAAGGVLNLMGNLGGVISIWAVPLMREPLGWTGLFAVWAAVAVVAALLWMAVRVERADPAVTA